MSISKSRSTLIWSGIVIVIAALIAAGYVWTRGQRTEEFTGAREPVRIGPIAGVGNALLRVAIEKGFLEQAGLDAEVKNYPTAVDSEKGMFAGEVDVSTVNDLPIVVSAFARQDFRIVGTISTADNSIGVAARKDRGIQTPKDLKGKRIGTQKNSVTHYFLHLFLLNHGLTEANVKLSFWKPEELPEALAKGEIDAFCLREPFFGQARKLLGDKLTVFKAPGLYFTTINLVVKESFARERPEAIRRVLKALVRAEEFVSSHAEEARGIVAKTLGMSDSETAVAWADYSFKVSLSNTLVSGLENDARWAMASKLTDRTSPPRFIDLVYSDALRAVRPEAVTIGAK